VENVATQSHIPESYLEHREVFAEPWVDRWVIPNPFIALLFGVLRTHGVELTDFSFNKDATSVGEHYLNISIRRLNAAVRIGLDTVTFIAANPAWEIAPQLANIFDQVSCSIRETLKTSPRWQETTLAFHVTPGAADFRANTAPLVNTSLLGEALFYGVSLHRADSVLIIDKSLRHEGAAFVRLQRKLPGDARFSDVAARIYEDEVSALHLLGIAGVP
jgi:hypothetical protein